jgi:mono/diheme cytochrome c family protein
VLAILALLIPAGLLGYAVGRMPAFDGQLSDAQIDAVARYVTEPPG